jgi:hypothetical protein
VPELVGALLALEELGVVGVLDVVDDGELD